MFGKNYFQLGHFYLMLLKVRNFFLPAITTGQTSMSKTFKVHYWVCFLQKSKTTSGEKMIGVTKFDPPHLKKNVLICKTSRNKSISLKFKVKWQHKTFFKIFYQSSFTQFSKLSSKSLIHNQIKEKVWENCKYFPISLCIWSRSHCRLKLIYF